MSCQVAAASDGEEALQTMEQNPFDVVLLDMRMPGQDGLSVLRTIKQKWPESEVVIITGYPTVDSAKEAVRLGAYDYVAKPVGPQDVINAADGAMTRKQWALRRVAGRAGDRRLSHEINPIAANSKRISKRRRPCPHHVKFSSSTTIRPSARASTGF